MQFLTDIRRRLFPHSPDRTVLLEHAFGERLPRHRCQVHWHDLLGCLAHARILLVQLAEHRPEALLKPQQISLAEEGLILTGGLEPRYDELSQPLLWPGHGNCLVLLPEEQAREPHRILNLKE